MLSKPLKFYAEGKVGNPALLFLHAFPFSGDMWKAQVSLFSEKFYCVAPDLSGFGASILPDFAVTFEFYVDSVLNFLKQSKIEHAVWCGLSMGGYLALRMYERAPGQCRALILCNTKAGPDGSEGKLKRWDAIQLLKQNRAEYIATQWQALIGASSKSNGFLRSRFEELIAKVNDKAIASGLVALATRTDCTPNLSKIHVPTLILVGKEDKVTPVSDSEAMVKAIAGSKMKVLERAGHLSNLENPHKFNEHLADFLSSLS